MLGAAAGFVLAVAIAHSRVAARWLLRYLEERSETTIEEASMVAGCLSALGSDGHDDAASILRAMSERHAA